MGGFKSDILGNVGVGGQFLVSVDHVHGTQIMVELNLYDTSSHLKRWSMY
jgi:hypothetical protein